MNLLCFCPCGYYKYDATFFMNSIMMNFFSECWSCFSTVARDAATDKSRQQEFDALYDDEEEDLLQQPLPQNAVIV
jgi:hypothetical protein